MSYKFKKDTSEYVSSLTPEMIKAAFEEYDFTLEYKEEVEQSVEEQFELFDGVYRTFKDGFNSNISNIVAISAYHVAGENLQKTKIVTFNHIAENSHDNISLSSFKEAKPIKIELIEAAGL